MADTDLHLDGNAVAGLLGEVFALEATTALVTCAHCGATGPVGGVHVYDRAPGVVLRCPVCEQVLMRFARIRDRLVTEMRGAAKLSFPPAA